MDRALIPVKDEHSFEGRTLKLEAESRMLYRFAIDETMSLHLEIEEIFGFCARTRRRRGIYWLSVVGR